MRGLTGIENKDAVFSDLKVFPNPATVSITVSIADSPAFPLNVKIIDIFGKIRGELVIDDKSENRFSLPVQNLPEGLYLLNIQSSGKAYQTKFLKK